MNLNLFTTSPEPSTEPLSQGAFILRQFAIAQAETLLENIDAIATQSPFRQMQASRGYTMSVAITNCGIAGWMSDHQGYRYSTIDPLAQQVWPVMPEAFRNLAQAAAREVGFADFQPDVCLINRYPVGAKMGLHQDRDERDLGVPIVSISLGLPATFLWGGLQRSDKVVKVLLQHGDVVVWGGASRLRFHGITPLKAGTHPFLGEQRINLTFRQAL